MPFEHQREAERLQILGDLRGEVMVFQPMAIKEISTGGAQVETAFPLHLDSLHELRLTLGDQSVVVKGRVVHCSISDVEQEGVVYRSGFEFIESSDRVYGVIAGFIDGAREICGWPRSVTTTGGAGASASVAAAAAFTRAFCARYGRAMPSKVSRTSC